VIINALIHYGGSRQTGRAHAFGIRGI
jgi:hypothetical protein